MKKLLFIALIALLASTARAQDSQNTETPTSESLIEAVLIQAAIKNIQENIRAAGRESGEIDKLIKALSGISVLDIERHGICGGKNSEVRKLFGSLCNDID